MLLHWQHNPASASKRQQPRCAQSVHNSCMAGAAHLFGRGAGHGLESGQRHLLVVAVGPCTQHAQHGSACGLAGAARQGVCACCRPCPPSAFCTAGHTRHTICIFVHHYTSWQTASHQLQHTFLVADGVKHRLNRVHAVQRRCTWRGQTGCFQCCECVSGQQISLPSRPRCHPGRHVHILIPPTCSFAFGLCYPWPMPSPHAAAQIHSPGSWLSA